ncbi:zinc-dependent peptidase [Rhodobacteraceae bacterium S2214]|nr:zinc-dependent peptidase [Rhodobacteraceae bacterium S2214]
MIYLISILIIAGLCYLAYRSWAAAQTRKHLLVSPLSDADRTILHTQVPLIRRLPPELHAPLEGKINLFLHQTDMYGCDGLEVTDEMVLSIAGQACLLIVNTDAWYKNLRTILIYPSAFHSVRKSSDGFVVKEERVIRLGESWARGPVILSWAHSQQGAMNDEDGHNVVLHEFAHQLDDLSGGVNGIPVLQKRQSFAQWERVFVDAYDRHLKKVRRGRKTLLDAYGATNHQEFLAVSVEAFFEKAEQLQEHEPALYAQLSTLLQLDPAAWPD